MIKIYTDGACANNQSNENFGGWGSILTYGKHVKKISGGEANTTNNRMELTAIVEALKLLKRSDIPVRVFTDSAYIVNCFNDKWYVKWRANGWKNAKKDPVLNRDLWEELLSLYESVNDIAVCKVKGHVDSSDDDKLKVEYQKLYEKLETADSNNRRACFDKVSFSEYKERILYNNEADELAVSAAKKVEEEVL